MLSDEQRWYAEQVPQVARDLMRDAIRTGQRVDPDAWAEDAMSLVDACVDQAHAAVRRAGRR